MIQTTVRELLQGKVDHLDLSGIYTIRDNEHILYIGRSVDVVQRIYNHIENWASSAIGNLIRTNRPHSYNWQIELREPEECREIAASIHPLYRENTTIPLTIESAELAMIEYHHPCWNTANNPNPTKLPSHIKRYESEIEAGATDNLF